jgi:quercetin dioxygenase-like cupin family protein
MAQPHAQFGQVVSVLPLGEALASAKTTAILKAEQLEVVRVVLLAGKEMREHSTPGEITVQGIEGRIEFKTSAGVQVLGPGDFMLLARGEPHSLRALSDASALVTIRL